MSNDNRQDAAESIFFARDLELQEAKLYEKLYPAIKFRTLIPVNNEGGPGVDSITYKMLDKTGVAQVLSDYADDLPRVNVSATEVTAKVKSLGNSAVYSQREIDSARLANRPLDSMLLNAMRESYERGLDSLADGGDTAAGLGGFNSNPYIPIVAATTSAALGDDTWPNKTADEIVADFSLAYKTIIENSKGIHQPNMAVMSPERLALLRQVRLSNTSATLAEYLARAFPGLQLEDWTKMSTASAAGTQRLAMYQKDSDVLEFKEPMPFKLYPLEKRGLKYIYNGEGRTAGVVVRYPFAAVFVDGI